MKITTQIPPTNLEEARNIFAFLQVPGALAALKVINEAGERGASLTEIVEKAELFNSYEDRLHSYLVARPTIERLSFIGLAICERPGPTIEIYRINPAISVTGLRILSALFPPTQEIEETEA